MRQLDLLSRPVPAARPVALDRDPCPDAPRPFVGCAMTLESLRRCAVCGNGCEVGSTVIAIDRWVAHVGCGHPDPHRGHKETHKREAAEAEQAVREARDT